MSTENSSGYHALHFISSLLCSSTVVMRWYMDRSRGGCDPISKGGWGVINLKLEEVLKQILPVTKALTKSHNPC